MTENAGEIEHAVSAMGNAMRKARANAKVGDVTTRDVGDVFRAEIAGALSRAGLDAR